MPDKTWFSIQNKAKNKAEIFIYDEIGAYGVTAKSFIESLEGIKDINDISLRINTPGGSITDGNAIYNGLKRLNGKLTVSIDSMCASMGTVIALAGDSVNMAANGLFMIHNPNGGAWGESEDLRTTADLMDKMKENILNVYNAKTGIDPKDLTDMMDKTTWFNAEEALELGFIDEITDKVEINNSFDMSNLGIIPAKYFNNFINSATSTPQPKEAVKMPKLETPVDDSTVDKDAIKNEFKAKEKARRDSITDVFAKFDHKELEAKCLNNMDISVSGAKEALLNKLGEKSEPTGSPALSGAREIESQSEKFIKGAGLALEAKAGLSKRDVNNEFNGHTQVELARAYLERNGIATSGMNKLQMVGRALMPVNSMHSTSDFSHVLANTANKSMLKGWEEAEETFQLWTQAGTLSDFKETNRVDLNSFGNLDMVGEGGEYKYGTIGDRGETIQLATYGKMFSITRQAIINDDLRVFTQIPQRMGRAAIRTIGNLVYAVLNNNPVMSDGTVLFHEDHGNLAATGAAPSTATFDAARVAMALQQDPDNLHALNIRPAYALVPVALEGAANVVVESETEIKASQNNSKVPNSVKGMVDVISDARLDTASSTAWYMAGGSMYDTIEVSYLDGQSTPTLEQQDGWSIDGVDFKVRIDAGVKALDYRTMYKNAGV